MSLTPGAHLGPYEILAPLGAGGMGAVYRARDPRLDRDVAIKVLLARFSTDPDRLHRFEQEARAAGRLNHPNILTIYDIGSHDGAPFLVSELLEGETLRERLLSGPVPLPKVADYAVQAARGLAAAHDKGIVHRDLKPENLFLTKDGVLKILDFGLAKLTEPAGADGATATALTDTGVIMGTVGYMSPEQAAGRPADFRSDQFSLGVILYEMVTGRRAFMRSSAAEILAAIIREEPEAVASLNPQAPPALRWLIERCLAKEPEERYASTRDLARDLEQLRTHWSELAAIPPLASIPSPRRRTALPLLVVALAAALAASGLTRWLARPQPPEPSALRFLTHSGHDYSPAASPDGRTIAFSSDRDGRPRIWLKSVDRGGEQVLTSGPDDSPRWSPDGSMILFTRTEAGRTSIYRAALVGGEARKVIEGAEYADWSPDGTRIAFSGRRFEGARPIHFIGVANADGSSPREVAHAEDRQLFYPRWSPDGRTIAAVQTLVYGPAWVFLVSADGTNPRAIPAPFGYSISAVAWCGLDEVVYSQAEIAVAAAQNTGSTAWLVRHNFRSGVARQILWLPHNSRTLDILGPGRLVFDTRSSRENLREIPLRGPSGGIRWLTRGNSQDRQPFYSPDGQRLLFTSDRSGNNDLWEMALQTGAVRRITEDPAEDQDPNYAPDGKNIIWTSNRGGHFEVWMADADGNAARRLSDHRSLTNNPTVASDGWVVYKLSDSRGQSFWKVRQDGLQATLLARGEGYLPQISPDGRYVARFMRSGSATLQGQIAIQLFQTSDAAVVPFEIRFSVVRPGRGLLGRSRFMPDGKAIAFLGQDANGVNGIFVQDFIPGQDTTKTRRPLGGFDPEMIAESFGISPDGSRMAVAAWEPMFSTMLAERVPGVAPPRRVPR